MLEDPNPPNDVGNTPLHLSAEQDHIEITKVLASMVKDSNTRNSDGQTPMYMAAQQGHTDIVKFLASIIRSLNLPKQLHALGYVRGCHHHQQLFSSEQKHSRLP